MVAVYGAPPVAQDKLDQALVLFSSADFEAALSYLKEAETLAETPKLRAETLMWQGILNHTLGQRGDALVSFFRAMKIEPNLQFDRAPMRDGALELLECASTLGLINMHEADVRRLSTDADTDKSWACPHVAPVVTRTTTSSAALSAEPLPSETIWTDAPDPAETTWRWSFIGAGGAAVVAGVVLDLVLPTGSNQQLDGADFVGVSLMAVGAGSILTGWLFNPYQRVK